LIRPQNAGEEVFPLGLGPADVNNDGILELIIKEANYERVRVVV
jgi:hypothetical protein